MKSAAITAIAAPSVAVTKPPKMPPRMITGMNSAQNASLSAVPESPELKRLLNRKIVFARVIVGQRHQAEPADDARQDAGDEHLHDRHFRHRGVQDHRN